MLQGKTMNLVDRCSVTELPARDAARGEAPLELALRHGGTAQVQLRYELVGREDAPVVLVAGGISAGRHAISSETFAEAGWWEAQADALSRHRLLSFDWIGADGSVDRPIDPADQAEAVIHLLDRLGIAKLQAFIGSSYGGMVGLHFAARYPERLGALLAISASGAPHPFASACRALQRRALTLGDPSAGVALARAMAMLTYRTPEEFAGRFAAPAEVRGGSVRVAAEDYLDVLGERHAARMSAIAYRRLSESIDLQRVDPSALRVPITLVAVDSDALVPAGDIESFAASVPGATLRHIHSRFGHDAFLKEQAQVAALITEFLDLLEKQA
jgi:homoserine O-acetyltransferase/O-succinyltransferase